MFLTRIGGVFGDSQPAHEGAFFMRFAISVILLSLLFACSSPEQEVVTVLVTATPQPTALPTGTPISQPELTDPNTPSPAAMPQPVATPAPISTSEPVSPIAIYTCANLIHKGKINTAGTAPFNLFPLNVEIVTIYNIKELNRTFTLLECQGEAAVRISNQFDKFYNVAYSINVDAEGELSVAYRFE